MRAISFTWFLFMGLLYGSSFGQTFYSDFEDGTLQEWTHTDGSATLLTVEEANYKYLQKTADGSNSSQGKLSIQNSSPEYWAGNYFYDVLGAETLRTIDDIFLKNPNDFDLHLRYSFTGANGYTVVTTHPLIVPAHTDWNFYNLSYAANFENNTLSNLTVINDTGMLPWEEVMQHLHELFEAVEEFRIFHAPSLSNEGAQVEGLFQIESLISYELLSTQELVQPSFRVFPNPMGDEVQISSEQPMERIVIYNSQGVRVYENRLNSLSEELQLQRLASGIYLVEITFEGGTVASKKLIKK